CATQHKALIYDDRRKRQIEPSRQKERHMRTLAMMAIGAVVLSGPSGGVAHGRGGQQAQQTQQTQQTSPGREAAQPAPAGAKDKAAYFANADLQSTWKDLEARQVINRRVL